MRTALAAATALILPSVALVAFTSQSAAAGPSPSNTVTTTITADGETAYSIPAGTISLTVTAVGQSANNGFSGSGTAGSGATVTATIAPPSGTTTLYAEVASGGGTSEFAGAGGGATSLQTCSAGSSGCTYTGDPSTDPRLIVAGGGGGVGESFGQTSGNGGNAGTTSSVTVPGSGGAGNDTGTAGNGGNAGVEVTPDTSAVGQGSTSCQIGGDNNGNGFVGAPGLGGNGGTGEFGSYGASGGAGGGGWVGGAGGGAGDCPNGGADDGAGGGGGAGTSYVPAAATSVSVAGNGGASPELVIVATLGFTTTVDDSATSASWSGTETTGAAAFDTATFLDFSPNATGTMDYFLFSDATCSGEPASSDTVTINDDGTVPASTSTGVLPAGSYSYLASYGGDINYAPITGSCETFTVGQATPSATTAVYDGATNLPWAGDEATGATSYAESTVSGAAGISPTGSVTYDLYSDDACSSTPVQSDVETLADGAVPNSAASSPLPAGSYSYQASYSGDSNYAAVASTCESFSVTSTSTAAATTVYDAGTSAAWTNTETAGSSAYDTATVAETAGIVPTGTVTYDYFTNNECSGTPDTTYQVNLEGDGTVPYSAATASLPVGGYSYQSNYSGDSNYNATVGDCEPFSVVLAAATVETTVTDAANNLGWTGNEAPGSSAYDAASVTGSNVTPTGTVTYSYFTDGSCVGEPDSTDLVTLNGDGAAPVSHPTGALAAGDYSYQAAYSGDSVYAAGTADCEPFSLGLVSSSTTNAVKDAATSAAWSGTEVAGSSAYDTAAVTGSTNVIPSGSLTYALYDNDSCDGDADTTQTVVLTGGVVPASADSGPLAAGSYSFQATYGGDSTFAPSASGCKAFTVLPAPADSYVALTPARILDTRSGTGYTGPLGPGQTITLTVDGAGGIPVSGVAAAALNVTATAATGGGYLTVYPAGVERQTTSNVNFTAGANVPNLAIVRVGTGGDVEIYNGAAKTVQVVVDVSGYFTAGNPSTPGAYGALTPARIMDTRTSLGVTGPTVPSHATVTLQVTGAGGVPETGVGAVALNLTVTNTAFGGYITTFAGGAAKPTSSNIDFSAGETLAELDVVPVSADGTVSFYNGTAGAVSLVADVEGFFIAGTPTMPGEFGAVAPTRILDTATGLGAREGAVAPGGNITLTIPGAGGVPSTDVGAVVLNVIAVGGSKGGYLTVYPNGESAPMASNVNYGVSLAVSNLVVVRVGENGQVVFHNGSSGTVQIYADVFGYFSGSAESPS